MCWMARGAGALTCRQPSADALPVLAVVAELAVGELVLADPPAAPELDPQAVSASAAIAASAIAPQARVRADEPRDIPAA
jgi:hypothetical protein